MKNKKKIKFWMIYLLLINKFYNFTKNNFIKNFINFFKIILI